MSTMMAPTYFTDQEQQFDFTDAARPCITTVITWCPFVRLLYYGLVFIVTGKNGADKYFLSHF